MERARATSPRRALLALSCVAAAAWLWFGPPCAAAGDPAAPEVTPLNQPEGTRVTGVAFHGNDHFSSKRLTKLTGVHPGDLVTPYEADSLAQQIESAYREKGYSLAAAHALLHGVGPEQQELLFAISEGPRTWVDEIEFEGNVHVDSDELLDEMESRTRGWPAFIWPAWFKEETFRDDPKKVEGLYRSRGYLDARAGGYVVYSDDMSRIKLRVVVYEGPLYHVSGISFEGNNLFRDSELMDALPFRVGDPCQPDKLDEAAARISELYASQGYMDVTTRKGNLRAEWIYPKAGTEVAVRFTIAEGEPVFIRRIEIRGLEKTKEHVVRRNLTFYPGERASTTKFKESQQVLTNTGYFDRATPEPVQISLEPDEGTLRDAIVEVKEGSTGWFMIGGAVGSESGLMGELSLTEENFDLSNWPSSWNDLWRGNAFRGGGHKLSFVLRAGTRRSYYAIDFLNPSVWDSDYSFGTGLYAKTTSHDKYDEGRTGLRLTGGQQLSKFVRRSIAVGYESIDVDNVDADASAEIMKDEGTHSKPYVTFGLTVDRRDNRFAPTQGHYANAELEAAAADVETLRLDLQARKYWTVHEDHGHNKHVIGVSGRMGLVDAYSGDRVPVFERYYAGGFNSIRGFDFEGVSPVDPVTKDQIGGESMLAGSVEYSFPLSEEDQLHMLFFADTGYVKEDVSEVLSGWDELRLSLGTGIRWRVPFLGGAGIEIDLAFPVMKEPEDETRYFHFSLGAQRQF